MTTATLPSGTAIVSAYSYDNADRLAGISHVKNGSTAVASVSYTLDDVGTRTQRVDQQGRHTYAYDDLHRLTSVTYPGPSTTTYDFDAFGNRVATKRTAAASRKTTSWIVPHRAPLLLPDSQSPKRISTPRWRTTKCVATKEGVPRDSGAWSRFGDRRTDGVLVCAQAPLCCRARRRLDPYGCFISGCASRNEPVGGWPDICGDWDSPRFDSADTCFNSQACQIRVVQSRRKPQRVGDAREIGRAETRVSSNNEDRRTSARDASLESDRPRHYSGRDARQHQRSFAVIIPRQYMDSAWMYAVPTSMLPTLNALAEISFHPVGGP